MSAVINTVRFSGRSLESPLGGVHPVCLQVDEQSPNEGIPLKMRHQAVGLVLGEYIITVTSLPPTPTQLQIIRCHIPYTVGERWFCHISHLCLCCIDGSLLKTDQSKEGLPGTCVYYTVMLFSDSVIQLQHRHVLGGYTVMVNIMNNGIGA